MKRIFGCLLLVTALCSCAHVTAVATTCRPTGADVDTALADLQSDGWEAALEQLVVARGVCIVGEAVKEIVATLKAPVQLDTPLGTPSNSDIVTRGQTWLAAHPK